MARSPRLFAPDLPPGFQYRDDFITETDERDLLVAIAGIGSSSRGSEGQRRARGSAGLR